MDRKTIFAFILIGVILILTQTDFYKESFLGLKQKQVNTHSDSSDVISIHEEKIETHIIKSEELDTHNFSIKNVKNEEPASQIFKNLQQADQGKDISINTNLYKAIISTKGAVIKSFQLNNYYYDKEEKIPVELIKNDGFGNLGIQFSLNEDTVFTYKYLFTANKTTVDLTRGKESDNVIFELIIDDNKRIRKTYSFHRDIYVIDLNIEFINLNEVIDNKKYNLVWLSGLHHTEKNILEDMRNSKAYIFTGGDKEELSLPEKLNQRRKTQRIEGKIDWVGLSTKYFVTIIFPDTDENIAVKLTGETYLLGNEIIKNFTTDLQFKISEIKQNEYNQKIRIYIGPLDYQIIKKYHSDFDKVMGYGPAIIRPFAKLTLSVFRFLHNYVPNYGVVLIIFSVLVKLVVYPLTRKSYVSMREMQNLQPLMNDLKEKYGKDPQRMNKEMMKLYKEHGVNPLSGCLPNLLQMPLLWAIFLVFRNTIQLRQEPFIWWINDLSSPDTILLPFSLPLTGNNFHIIPILMGITMFIQQKMTMKDPKQKAMVYFMPIFLTFIFYKFPSGLNLYYTLFNIFSMIQQLVVINKHDKNENTLQSETYKTQ